MQIGSKLVVLGPQASMPSDFQIIRHQLPGPANRNIARQHLPQHHDPLHLPMVNNRINPNQIMEEANRRLREELNRPINRENIAGIPEHGNLIRRNMQEDEAVSRLKRNLQLKSRDEDHYLPKRFDEPTQDRLGMAAFSVNANPVSPPPHERRLEFLRRMEEKIRAMRRAREQEDAPNAKRLKRNCIGIFVCDISNLLASEPTLAWIEYKHFGLIQGAPERLILSSLVAGNGELIMFGGLRKESLSSTTTTMQVSNALHFLTFPRGVI